MDKISLLGKIKI